MIAAHEGQKRKFTGRDYHYHPEEVREIVASVGGTDDMQTAALLHDVIEDVAPIKPQYGLDAIIEQFGPVVAGYVIALTNVFTKAAYPAANRAKRHNWEHLRLALQSDEVKIIKMADRLANVREMPVDGFGKKYAKETRELLRAVMVNDAKWGAAYLVLFSEISKELSKWSK